MPAAAQPAAPAPPMLVRHLGRVDYERTWHEMQSFTDCRSPDTPDEVWYLQHTPVFTLGRNTRQEHLIDTGDIPVIQVDRGGQVTYHGPGQLVVYPLLDLKRRQLGVQSLVHILEQTVIDLLASHGVTALRRHKAPGVYVDDRKIAALGLRVRRGCCFHGLSLNVDMDLAPFARINPCGYPGMQVTQLADYGVTQPLDTITHRFQAHFERLLENPE
ncbi:MAG: lipoyl(octanoyl) transferase LipB, partial [Gammaproteobacteria bacterium]